MNKIVFITNAMLIGGAEKVIATLSNYFVNKGVEVSIITIMNTECQFNLNEQVKCYSIYEKEGKPRRKEYAHYYNKLKEEVRKENPDIVVIMPEEISVKAIPFLIDLKIPIVVSERNNPWVMPKNKLNRILRKINYKKVDGIVFQTETAKSYFSKEIQEKGSVIPNPIDYSRLPKEYDGPRKKNIVSMGRLVEQKNHKLLLNAFSIIVKEHSEYKLLIYGDGELREELEVLARNTLPSDSYEIKPATNEVLNYINDASIFVLSSNYEGLPNALIEAMALGLPVISTDCQSGGPRSLIQNYKNGILVEPKNAEDMALAINELINNKKLADKLGRNAKKIRYLLEEGKIMAKWESFFNKVIDNYKGKSK
ncbi:MAG: glycosyltransferase family 4 protein [Lachnospiraceae bacterium]|nr:glycosyltransferase family 4 protein [Lachnospiraceae bacterium]